MWLVAVSAGRGIGSDCDGRCGYVLCPARCLVLLVRVLVGRRRRRHGDGDGGKSCGTVTLRDGNPLSRNGRNNLGVPAHTGRATTQGNRSRQTHNGQERRRMMTAYYLLLPVRLLHQYLLNSSAIIIITSISIAILLPSPRPRLPADALRGIPPSQEPCLPPTNTRALQRNKTSPAYYEYYTTYVVSISRQYVAKFHPQ